jgi:transposase-like protein
MNKSFTERQRARLKWIKLYKPVKDIGIVCRKCGISQLTLRQWLKRYEEEGLAGLEDHSRKPWPSPFRKVFSKQEDIIRTLRQERKLGAGRI